MIYLQGQSTDMLTKQKYAAMDFLRILAFFFIILYHFMFELEQKGIFNFKKYAGGYIYYENSNFNIAMIGVSLFFMLSGAGLMHSSERKWNIKEFYVRRFSRLLIPFYIAEVFVLIASFAIKPEWVIYFPQVPKYRAVFNLFAMDGYFERYFQTFCLHVGEWFLGALIMLYVIFPLLRFFMKKNRYVTIGVATVYYLCMVFTDVIHVTPWNNVFLKVYDFVLGMFLITEIPGLMEKKVVRRVLRYTTLALIIFGVFFKPALPTPVTFNNLLYAIILFIHFFTYEKLGDGEKEIGAKAKGYKIVESICRISYEIFLVHHVIIYYVGDNLAGAPIGGYQVVALFITEIIVMVGMALFVRLLEKPIYKIPFLNENNICKRK